jgi:hypothetical protein
MLLHTEEIHHDRNYYSVFVKLTFPQIAEKGCYSTGILWWKCRINKVIISHGHFVISYFIHEFNNMSSVWGDSLSRFNSERPLQILMKFISGLWNQNTTDTFLFVRINFKWNWSRTLFLSFFFNKQKKLLIHYILHGHAWNFCLEHFEFNAHLNKSEENNLHFYRAWLRALKQLISMWNKWTSGLVW